MATAREKEVMKSLLPLYNQTHYLIDMIVDVGRVIGKGDTLDIPYLGALTVASTGASDVTAQSGVPSAATLTADKDPAIFVELPHVSRTQLMSGAWSGALAPQIIAQLKNHVDTEIIEKLVLETLVYDADGDNHVNPGSDALATTDMVNVRAKGMAAHKGPKRLAIMAHPYGVASMMNISGYIQREKSASGVLGVPMVGEINGIPVLESNSVPNGRTFTATSTSVTSNVMTVTYSAGHGLATGMKITTSGADNDDVASAAAVTVTGSTTFTVPLTTCNGSNGTPVITVEACENLLLDLNMLWGAQQRTPFIREVAQEARTGDVLQATTIYGRAGIAGYSAKVLCSPKDGAA